MKAYGSRRGFYPETERHGTRASQERDSVRRAVRKRERQNGVRSANRAIPDPVAEREQDELDAFVTEPHEDQFWAHWWLKRWK